MAVDFLVPFLPGGRAWWQVGVQRLKQQALAAEGLGQLEDQIPQQAHGSNAGSADAGAEATQARREAAQH